MQVPGQYLRQKLNHILIILIIIIINIIFNIRSQRRWKQSLAAVQQQLRRAETMKPQAKSDPERAEKDRKIK